MFTAYFQAWDASRKQRTTADYDARVAALNEEADAAAKAEEGTQPEAEAQPEEAAEPAEADAAPADEPCALPLSVTTAFFGRTATPAAACASMCCFGWFNLRPAVSSTAAPAYSGYGRCINACATADLVLMVYIMLLFDEAAALAVRLHYGVRCELKACVKRCAFNDRCACRPAAEAPAPAAAPAATEGEAAKAPELSASSTSPTTAEPKNGQAGSAHSSTSGAMPAGSMKHGVLTAATVRGAADFKPSDEDPSGSKGTELKFKPGEVSSDVPAVRCRLLQVIRCLELGLCGQISQLACVSAEVSACVAAWGHAMLSHTAQGHISCLVS